MVVELESSPKPKKGGRRTRDLSSFTPQVWEAPEGYCSHCGRPLTIQQHRKRPLQTLNGGHYDLVLKDRRCSSKECPGWATIHRPTEECSNIVKGREYAIDIIAFVGEWRHHEDRSFPRIFKELTEKHDVIISERHVPYLFQLYLAIVRCRSLEDQVVIAKLKAQKRLILSADAVRLDDVSPPLYVVREVISGEILCAKRIERPTTQALIEFISPIKDLGVPVEGIIIDKELAQLKAFEEVFAGVPLQICQTHYLKNLTLPMESDLKKLADGVREVVKEVKDLKAAVSQSKHTAERELVETLCAAVQAVGKSHAGDKLFAPPALKRYQRLTQLADDTRQAFEPEPKEENSSKPNGKEKDLSDDTPQSSKLKLGDFPFLARLLVILATMSSSWGELSTRLERQFQVVREIAHILNLRECGTAVALRLQAYLDQLFKETPSVARCAETDLFYRKVVAVSERFWKGLFHCYDNPDLPPNNNTLEQFYGALKQQARRIGGRKSTSGGPLESFAPYILEIWARLEERPSLERLLAGLAPEKLQKARKELEEIAAPARRRRAFLRDPSKQTSEALKRFVTSSGSVTSNP